jgi:hypothetical protein
LCYFHANPNKAAEMGRIGGSKKSRTVQSSEPLPTVDNAIAVRDLVARLIADLHAGKIHPKIAAGLAPLMNLQLRAIETSNLELRVEKLEKLLTRLAAGRDKKGDMQPSNAWRRSANHWMGKPSRYTPREMPKIAQNHSLTCLKQ